MPLFLPFIFPLWFSFQSFFLFSLNFSCMLLCSIFSFLSISPPFSFLPPLLLFMATPLYIVCYCMIYPFCLYRTAHQRVSCPTTTSAQDVLVAPLFISEQNYLFCFLPLSVLISPIWIRIKPSLHLPLWHALSGPSPYLPLLDEMSS